MQNQRMMRNAPSVRDVARKNGRKKLQRKRPNALRRSENENTRKSQKSLQSEVAATPENGQALDVVMIERDLPRDDAMIENARLADVAMREIDPAPDVDHHHQLARLDRFDLCMPISDMEKIDLHQGHDPAHPIASLHALSDRTNGEVAADVPAQEVQRDHQRKRKTMASLAPVPSHRRLISTQ